MKRRFVLVGIFCLGCDFLSLPSSDADDEAGATHGDGNCLVKGAHQGCDIAVTPDCCEEDSIGCNGMGLTRTADGYCDVQPVEGQECYMQNINQPNLCCNTPGGLGAIGTVSASCIDSYLQDCVSDADCMLGDTCQFDDFSGQYLCGGSLGQSCITPYYTPEPYGCCPGLIVGDDGYCGLPSGAACLEYRECASRVCVPGDTTAVCQ